MKKRNLMWMMAAALVFAGCTSGGEETSSVSSLASSSVAASVEEAKADLTLGTEDAESKSVLIENKTGQAIKGFAAALPSSSAEAKNLIADNMEWKNDQTAEYFFNPEEVKHEAAAEGEDVAAATEYVNITLTFADDSTAVLHQTALEDIDKDAALETKDGVVYLTYTAKNGDQVDTYESEKSWAEQEAAAQAADQAAADAAAVQEDAYVEPVYEEPVYEEPVYTEPVYQEPVYQEPVYETPTDTPAVGDQQAQGCLDTDQLVFN